MDTAHNSKPVSTERYIGFATAGLVIALLIIAAQGRERVAETAPSLVDARALVQLRFVDRRDGGVDVISATSGEQVSEFAPTTNGFARSVMRSFTRDRHRSGIGPEIPFELMLRADGGISLHDPATGRQVSLDAFGSENLRVFSDLLRAAQPKSAVAKI
ncbi:MAG: photosynthetic complex assembly protein PuhC [Proteobacteria bacterium]|nr:photosynthetic complex assembly protein PuhC [Pseudomonadota bacterium]